MRYFYLALLLLLPSAVCAERALPWNDGDKSVAEQMQTGASSAAPEEARDDPKIRQAVLARVGQYLSNIKSLKSEFTQVSPDGGLAEGTFYLQRPGKMRWQYAPPTPILMLSNGDFLTFIDYELEQVSHVPMDESLASFISKERIDFSDPAIEVVDVRQGAGVIQVSLIEREKAENGLLTLEFSESPLSLRTMAMVDQSGQITRIGLSNARYNIPLDKALFVYENPRFGPRVKR